MMDFAEDGKAVARKDPLAPQNDAISLPAR
jgi:hypothetical protein